MHTVATLNSNHDSTFQLVTDGVKVNQAELLAYKLFGIVAGEAIEYLKYRNIPLGGRGSASDPAEELTALPRLPS